jgi:hypothetical protein
MGCLICHWERQKSPDHVTNAQLANSVTELWDGRLQLDGTWIVYSEHTADEIGTNYCRMFRRVMPSS